MNMDSQRLHGVEIGFGIGRTTKSFGAFARPPQRRQDASAVLVDKTRDCDLRRRLSAWDSLCMLLITSPAPASMTSFQVRICARHKPLFQS